MKRKNLAKKLTALMMTGAMVVSMGMTAFAEDSWEAVTSMKVKKELKVAEKTYAPDTTFDFVIEEVDEGEGKTITINEKDIFVKSGVPGMFGNGKLSMQSTPGSEYKEEGYSFDASCNVIVPKGITEPGVYHYTIREIDNGFEGITYDGSVMDLYVTVAAVTENNVPTGKLYIYGIVAIDAEGKIVGGAGTEKTDLVFTNDYGKDNELVKTLKITKTVKGNQSSKSDTFKFEVRVDADNNKTTEKYVVALYNENDQMKGDEQVIVSGSSAAFTEVQHGDYIKIYGLTAGDEYTVKETDANGYTKTYTQNVNEDELTVSENLTINGSLQMVDDKLSDGNAYFENEKNVTTPTGIAMTFAPYALMVAFAGVFAVMFLRKKREDF